MTVQARDDGALEVSALAGQKWLGAGYMWRRWSDTVSVPQSVVPTWWLSMCEAHIIKVLQICVS